MPENLQFAGLHAALLQGFVEPAARDESGIELAFLHGRDGTVVRTGKHHPLEIGFGRQSGLAHDRLAGQDGARGAGRVGQAERGAAQAFERVDGAVAADDEQGAIGEHGFRAVAGAGRKARKGRDPGAAADRDGIGSRSELRQVNAVAEQAFDGRGVGRRGNDFDAVAERLFQLPDERAVLGKLCRRVLDRA